jgi:hypothetical protein
MTSPCIYTFLLGSVNNGEMFADNINQKEEK